MFIHKLVILSILESLQFYKLTKKRKPLPKTLLNGDCFITGKNVWWSYWQMHTLWIVNEGHLIIRFIPVWTRKE